jgi:hypothetical protein
MSANGAMHQGLGAQLLPKCGDEAGLWPAVYVDDPVPVALPRADMSDAFGVSILNASALND